jgi:mxaA protein
MKRRANASALAGWLLRGASVVMLVFADAASVRADDAIDSGIQPIVTFRDSGYLLGDLIDERADLKLPAGFSLDADSLPLPGRVAPWLEMRASRIEAQRANGTTGVVVTYQIFAEVEQASRVPIPPFRLRVRDGAQSRLVNVPEQSFLLSPVLPLTLTDEDRELKPSPLPQTLRLTRTIVGFALSVIAALACAGYLLWLYDRLPFLPRSPGPFARTWRRWRRRAGAQVSWWPWMARKDRRGRRAISDAERAVLLRDWHAALNQAAGETLYTSTLPRLFVRAPHLELLRQEVEGTFEQSWKSFYGTAQSSAPAAREILELLRRSADRERGVPC